MEMGGNKVIRGPPQEMARPSYEAAMEALSSLISRRKRGDGSQMGEKFELMFRYLKILDLEEHIDGLKIIHIAGTKGKGSTCTFCEAILRESGFRTGLFTSPHLIDVRERYRINGLDITEDDFLHYFWDCWNRLKEKNVEDLPMPPLFQFLTLLAFKIFLSEKVDVAILEVGLGGRLDSTNVIKEPIVCGITSLGMDHMEILGDSIAKIAYEKAGIFKPCVPAFTVSQLSAAMFVLQERASELMIPLNVASPLDSKMLMGLKLGLAGDHQFINAGLAVALCKCWLQINEHLKFFQNDDPETGLPKAFLRGLSIARLPGRAQIINDNPENFSMASEVNEDFGDLIFYIDGAHSPESMEVCSKWFSNAVRDDKMKELYRHPSTLNEKSHDNKSNKISKKILLFNCMEARDPQLLLPQLINTCSSSGVYFSNALFVPAMSAYHRVDSGASLVSSDTSKDLSWQFTLQRTWDKLIGGQGVISENSSKFENPENLSCNGTLNGDASEKCNSGGKNFVSSSVIPSLPLAIKWLRGCAKENPSLRLQGNFGQRRRRMEDEEFEGGVVVGQLATVTVPRHIKKRALKNKALNVGFNDKDLRDYVTGFHKRKKKRRKEAQQHLQEKDRLKRIQARKKRKLEREFALFGGAPPEDQQGSGSGPGDVGLEHVEDELNLNPSVTGTKMYETEDTKIVVTTTELSREDENYLKAMHSIPRMSSRDEKKQSLTVKKKPLKRVVKPKSRKKARNRASEKKDKRGGRNKR